MRRSLATQCMCMRLKAVLHAKCATCALTMQFRGQCCSGGHFLFLWTVAPSTVQSLYPHTASSDRTATGAFQQHQPTSFGRPVIACLCCSQYYEHDVHLCVCCPKSSIYVHLLCLEFNELYVHGSGHCSKGCVDLLELDF